MLQMVNKSPFAPSVFVLPDRDGVDTIHALVKATFTLVPELALAEVQVRPQVADVSWGEPGVSSLKYASEVHTGKPTTDVVLVGNAWASSRGVAEMQVVVTAAERQKAVRVFGARRWNGTAGGFTRPEPFESMPLVYERAFGGADPPEARERAAEERNPVGVGFRGRPGADLAGTSLPNLEDPRRLIQRAGDRPPPACFGFIAPSWLPRRAHAGTYDERWRRTRAPFLPVDFDPRFFNAACPELTFDRFLAGGEPFVVTGATRDRAPLRFALPTTRPRVQVDMSNRWEKPPMNLETVLIEPDGNRLCLTWRATLACDKQALRVRSLFIEGVD